MGLPGFDVYGLWTTDMFSSSLSSLLKKPKRPGRSLSVLEKPRRQPRTPLSLSAFGAVPGEFSIYP
jgi:hypothetical protein